MSTGNAPAVETGSEITEVETEVATIVCVGAQER